MKVRTLIASVALAAAVLLSSAGVQARIPDGWPFLDFNAAVKAAQEQGKPLFVYFGFATCSYCLYLNENALASDTLRKRYSDHYVLAYFDVRGNRSDIITLPGGGQISRGEAIKRLKVSVVPTWMFVDPEGRTILVRRGSRTTTGAFVNYDLYVASGAYKQVSYEDFLAQRGLREDAVE